MAKIEIYPQNTETVSRTVSFNATGYTPYLTVRKQTTDEDLILSKTGSVSDASTVVFYLSSIDTSILKGNYIYDITLEADTSIYTIAKDKFSVIDGVRY
jgi:hypothetical protein